MPDIDIRWLVFNIKIVLFFGAILERQQKSVLYGCGVPSMWVRASGKVLSVESNFLVQARLNRFRVVLHIQESLKV